MRRRIGWIAISVAAVCLMAACFVPTFEIRIEAYIGAGASQQGFHYDRRLSVVPDAVPFGLLPLLAGVFLLAAGIFGAIRRPSPWLVITTFVVAVGLAVLVFDTEDRRLDWPGRVGVIGYEQDNGGPLLGPGLDDLHAAAKASPEAQRPGWTLLGGRYGYASRGLYGWRLFLWSTLVLVWLSGYQLVRLRLRPIPSALVVAGVSVIVAAWLLLRAFSRLE